MSCGCSSAKLVPTLQSELKLWRERCLYEVKYRKIIEEWILYTFGYDVKVEYDRTSCGARVEAIENRDAMKNATFQFDHQDGEMKIVVMELKVTNSDNDPYEDHVGFVGTGLDSLEIEDNPDNLIFSTSAGTKSNRSGDASSGQIYISSGTNAGTQQLQFNQPIEISSQDNNGTEVVYLGNYEDGNITGGQQQYYIVKSSDNDDNPIQFDYSSLINSDIGTDKVFYRIAAQNEGSNEVMLIQTQAATASPVKSQKRKLPASAPKSSSKVPKTKKTTPTTPTTVSRQAVPLAGGTLLGKMAAATSKTLASPTFVSKKASQTKSSEERQPNAGKSMIEFGLTMREKAEIYVRTKARQAIRKHGSGYLCTLCPNMNYSYSSVDNALTHTKSHFESTPYKCDFSDCEAAFGIQKELLRHRKEAHPKLPKSSTTSVDVSKSSVKQGPAGPALNPSTPTNIIQIPINTPTFLPASPIASFDIPELLPITRTVTTTVSKSTVIKESKKPFKCLEKFCEWSYATAEELGWHMKAHSQARV